MLESLVLIMCSLQTFPNDYLSICPCFVLHHTPSKPHPFYTTPLLHHTPSTPHPFYTTPLLHHTCSTQHYDILVDVSAPNDDTTSRNSNDTTNDSQSNEQRTAEDPEVLTRRDSLTSQTSNTAEARGETNDCEITDAGNITAGILVDY